MHHFFPHASPLLLRRIGRPALGLACLALTASNTVHATTVTQTRTMVTSLAIEGAFSSDIAVVGPRLVFGSPSNNALPTLTQRGIVSQWVRNGNGVFGLADTTISPTQASNSRFGGRIDAFGTRVLVAEDLPAQVHIDEADFLNNLNLVTTLAPQALGIQGSSPLIEVATFSDYAAVGVLRNENNSGTVELFRLANGTWSSVQTLSGATLPGLEFGAALSMTENHLFVGVPSSTLFNFSGQMVIYARPSSGSTWTFAQLVQVPTALPATTGTAFGAAIDSDGLLAVVGSPGQRETAAGPAIGAAVVYEFVSSANTWVRRASLINPDAEDGAAFGAAVAVSGDRILVGAPQGNGNLGRAYWFERVDTDNWTLVQRMDRFNATVVGEEFGASVAFAGNSAIVGAPGFGNNNRGAAYEFVRDPSFSNGFE